MVCLVHALLPFLFVKTGSRIIMELNERMVANRVQEKHRAKFAATATGQ